MIAFIDASVSLLLAGSVRRSVTGFCIAYEYSYQEGCSLGSLASEIIQTDLDVRTALANAFEQWRDTFRDGIERMHRLGRVSAEADPTRLDRCGVDPHRRGSSAPFRYNRSSQPAPTIGSGLPLRRRQGHEAWPRESRADRGYFVHWSSGRCLAGCRPGCRAFDVVAPQHL